MTFITFLVTKVYVQQCNAMHRDNIAQRYALPYCIVQCIVRCIPLIRSKVTSSLRRFFSVLNLLVASNGHSAIYNVPAVRSFKALKTKAI